MFMRSGGPRGTGYLFTLLQLRDIIESHRLPDSKRHSRNQRYERYQTDAWRPGAQSCRDKCPTTFCIRPLRDWIGRTGWLLHIIILKSVLPGLVSMKVNTAGAFLAAGVSLWLLHTAHPNAPTHGLARALAIIVAMLGGLTLTEDLFGPDFGIDQLVLPDGLSKHKAESWACAAFSLTLPLLPCSFSVARSSSRPAAQE
jgi:hypothetical protein